MPKFIFDLDGTITAVETLPLIARHFGVEAEIEALTQETIRGNIPFMESFIRRVHILGKLPVAEVSALLTTVPTYPLVTRFIQNHRDHCVIATGNLFCWVEALVHRMGCPCFYSEATLEHGVVKQLTHIVRKEEVVQRFKEQGEKVVFIGDGNNDAEAMRLAHVSIASGLTHWPAPSVLAVADYLVFSEEALCRQLTQLC